MELGFGDYLDARTLGFVVLILTTVGVVWLLVEPVKDLRHMWRIRRSERAIREIAPELFDHPRRPPVGGWLTVPPALHPLSPEDRGMASGEDQIRHRSSVNGRGHIPRRRTH
jgi:hypothetical protein